MLTNFISTASVYIVFIRNVIILFAASFRGCVSRRRLIGVPMRNPTELRYYGLRPSQSPNNRNESVVINNSILTYRSMDLSQ